MGIKQPQLARIESGKQVPRLDTLVKLAAGAGYTLEVNFIPPQNRRTRKMKPLKFTHPELVESPWTNNLKTLLQEVTKKKQAGEELPALLLKLASLAWQNKIEEIQGARVKKVIGGEQTTTNLGQVITFKNYKRKINEAIADG